MIFRLVVTALVTMFSFGAFSAEQAISFRREIAPILTAKCLTCHNADKPKGKYRLDSYAHLFKTGSSDKELIVAGSPDQSYLLELINSADPDDRMPQKDEPLPVTQRQLIRNWIAQGATFDGEDTNAPIASLNAPVYLLPPNKYPTAVPILAIERTEAGEILASGYNEVTLWNSANQTLLARLTNAPSHIHDLVLSPDGTLLAIAGGTPGRNGEVALFDLSSKTKKASLGNFPDVMLAVAFSPDGARVLGGGSDNTIHVWETATGKELLSIQQHADWVTSISISSNGKTIVSGSRDKTVRTYDLATGQSQTTFTDHQGPVWSAIFRPGKDHIISAGRDKVIRIWKVEDGGNVAKLENQPAEVFDLCASEDRLYAALRNGTVREYDLTNTKLLRTIELGSSPIYSLMFNDGLIAAGTHAGYIHLFGADPAKAPTFFLAAPGLP